MLVEGVADAVGGSWLAVWDDVVLPERARETLGCSRLRLRELVKRFDSDGVVVMLSSEEGDAVCVGHS